MHHHEVAVWVGTPDLATDPAPTLDALLNAPTGMPGAVPGTGTAGFAVSSVPDLGAAREAVTAGTYVAVLGIVRDQGGELEFTLYTNERATGRTAQLVQQASNAVAIADRLDRLGVAPADQASLFAPASYEVTWPEPGRTDPPEGSLEAGSSYLLGFGMTILIFMMIVLYGNWVAASVVEENSSRVMEVILNGATPFQLMAGKVLGVGSVALVQFAAILVAGIVALLLQGQVAELVLGPAAGGVELPEGLTIGMLLAFVVYGVLGFLLYAVLYAAAGSLVSPISTAVGMARAEAIAGRKGNVVAVVGDASIVNGLAFEGLNNAGTLGRQLLISDNINLTPPVVLTAANAPSLGVTAPSPQQLGRNYYTRDRLDPSFNNIQQVSSGGRGRYDGLQLNVQKRMRKGFQLRASYVLSTAKDDASDFVQAQQPNDPYDRDGEYSYSEEHQRHRLTFTGVWRLPYQKQKGESSAMKAIFGHREDGFTPIVLNEIGDELKVPRAKWQESSRRPR